MAGRRPCRACLRTESVQLVSLFESSDLARKMMLCANVEIDRDDRLPDQICSACVARLDVSYTFRILCENSDSALRRNVCAVKADGSFSFDCDSFYVKKDEVQLQNPNVSVVDEKRNSSDEGATRFEDEDSCVGEKGKETDDADVETVLRKNKSKRKRQIKVAREGRCKKKNAKLKSQNREQCFTCGKVMSSKFRLKMHLRIHTGEKPFTCNYCHKTFALSQNLKVHERVHTGEKPLVCSTCGKSFAQSAGLVAHMRLHTGETPYKCTLCPSSFRTPGHLQYHIRQHTGEKKFECLLCGKAFITKGDLTQHVKTHTGERPYICTVCGLRMSRSSHLTRHMMTHTGEKPHRCEICDLSYAQKGDLVRHVKKHSPVGQCKILTSNHQL